jgi:Fe-S-cluster-containing dehydrogenase component
MAHNAIVVNLDRCIGCYGCEVACKMENDIALGERWNKVVQVEPYGAFPKVSSYWLPTHCQQCADAPCVAVCPTGASYRDEVSNIVLVDKEKCIGCKYCMMACPYGVRSWNEEQKVVEKCTLCNHLTAAGELPACVKNCCGQARAYGDLDDPGSDAARMVAAADASARHYLPNVGNNPQTVYIFSERYGTWAGGDLVQRTGPYVGTEGSDD